MVVPDQVGKKLLKIAGVAQLLRTTRERDRVMAVTIWIALLSQCWRIAPHPPHFRRPRCQDPRRHRVTPNPLLGLSSNCGRGVRGRRIVPCTHASGTCEGLLDFDVIQLSRGIVNDLPPVGLVKLTKRFVDEVLRARPGGGGMRVV